MEKQKVADGSILAINTKMIEKRKNDLDTEVNLFIEEANLNDEIEYKKTKNYLEWLQKKSNIVRNENAFKIPNEQVLKRGNVVWVEFGFNIGKEFGGRHPALILRRTGDSVFVVPLSSQEPTKKKDWHVEIKKVYGFKNMTRWVNVLRVVSVSVQRIDFSASIGNVKGEVLNDINEALEKSRIS